MDSSPELSRDISGFITGKMEQEEDEEWSFAEGISTEKCSGKKIKKEMHFNITSNETRQEYLNGFANKGFLIVVLQVSLKWAKRWVIVWAYDLDSDLKIV